MEIPLEQLPFTAEVYRNTSTVAGGSDWAGPKYTLVTDSMRCLVSWSNALYATIPLGDYSDNSAMLFTLPDEDLKPRDRIVVTIGEREYTFIIENLPRVFYHPISWVPHHIECSLKEQQ